MQEPVQPQPSPWRCNADPGPFPCGRVGLGDAHDQGLHEREGSSGSHSSMSQRPRSSERRSLSEFSSEAPLDSTPLSFPAAFDGVDDKMSSPCPLPAPPQRSAQAPAPAVPPGASAATRGRRTLGPCSSGPGQREAVRLGLRQSRACRTRAIARCTQVLLPIVTPEALEVQHRVRGRRVPRHLYAHLAAHVLGDRPRDRAGLLRHQLAEALPLQRSPDAVGCGIGGAPPGQPEPPDS